MIARGTTRIEGKLPTLWGAGKFPMPAASNGAGRMQLLISWETFTASAPKGKAAPPRTVAFSHGDILFAA